MKMKMLVTKVGDCLASIAKQHGFENPSAIYEHEANAALRAARPNMHVLQAGDPVTIPAKSQKTVPLNASGKLVLKVKGQTSLFATQIEDFDGAPLANKPYELEVAGLIRKGISDHQGFIRQRIDASAKTGTLRVFLDSFRKNILTWPLEFGALPPHHHPVGVQARLNNLGYYCANEVGEIEHTTQAAVLAFKTQHGLHPTATIDEAFLQKLLQAYGF